MAKRKKPIAIEQRDETPAPAWMTPADFESVQGAGTSTSLGDYAWLGESGSAGDIQSLSDEYVRREVLRRVLFEIVKSHPASGSMKVAVDLTDSDRRGDVAIRLLLGEQGLRGKPTRISAKDLIPVGESYLAAYFQLGADMDETYIDTIIKSHLRESRRYTEDQIINALPVWRRQFADQKNTVLMLACGTRADIEQRCSAATASLIAILERLKFICTPRNGG